MVFVMGCQQTQAGNISFLSALVVFARFLSSPGLTPSPAPELYYTSKNLPFLHWTGLDNSVFVELSAAQTPPLHSFSAFGLSFMLLLRQVSLFFCAFVWALRQMCDAEGHLLLAGAGSVDSGFCSFDLNFNTDEWKTIAAAIATYKHFNRGAKFYTLWSWGY